MLWLLPRPDCSQSEKHFRQQCACLRLFILSTITRRESRWKCQPVLDHVLRAREGRFISYRAVIIVLSEATKA